MLDLSEYPKTVSLSDGDEVVIRLLKVNDESELARFMKSLPSKERIYFRDDVSDPDVISAWCQTISLEKAIPLIAVKDDRLIANWSMHIREHGWTRHLANIRGIVHPDYRRKGLAAQMVYELLSIAQGLELERAVIELVRPQKRLVKHFGNIGFEVVAVLEDWIKDARGKYQDLQILSMKIEPAWKKMEELILDYGTHGG